MKPEERKEIRFATIEREIVYDTEHNIRLVLRPLSRAQAERILALHDGRFRRMNLAVTVTLCVLKVDGTTEHARLFSTHIRIPDADDMTVHDTERVNAMSLARMQLEEADKVLELCPEAER